MSSVTARQPAADRADELLLGIEGPMRAIRGQCHAIVRVATRPQELISLLCAIDQELEALARSARRLRGLVVGDDQGDDRSLVDLASVIRDTAERFAPAAAEHGLTLLVAAHGRCRRVHAQVDAVHRMIDGLVVDALASAPTGSCITVALTERGSRAVVRVSDERTTREPGVAWAIVGAVAARNRGSLTCEPATLGVSARIELPVGVPPTTGAAA